MVEEKPIEKYFPIHEVNQIASYESTGFGRRWYRPIYVIHKWWARRLGTIFRSIILYSLINEKKNNFLCNKKGNIETHIKSDTEKLRNWKNLYYRDLEFKDKTILDPFFGGGTTIIEALRLGCKVIGKELNPVAWFVTKKEVEPVSLPKLKEQFEIIDKQISSEILKYYKTKCPVCGKEASVMYFFWYKVLNCLNCKEEVPLFKDYRIGKYRSINSEHKKRVRCVSCNEFYDPLKNEKCPYCGENFEYKKYYYVLCPQCKKLFGMHLYRKASKNENTPCPHCGHNFNPKKGPASGQYYTCSNGHKRKIIETIQRNGKPKEELYAIEYFCEYCDKRGYKSIDNFDKDLFQKAVQEYKDIKNSLPIPRTKIQNGYNTKQILNHKYEKFDDLFNKRQLLNLGKIFQKILEIDDQNIKEYFILAFSNTLKYNNMLCKYDRSNNTITDIFRTHTYHPSFTPVECSCYNAPRGRGSFSAFINLVIEGKEFNNQPHEYIIHPDRDNERVDNFSPFHGIVKNEFKEIKEENRVLLFNGSSEYLEIPDKSVDAVITDPPYYDNVMYSELSDFFYVWLREGLKDDYPFFQAELTPKRSEIVKNKYQGKGDEEFTEGLTNVFRECHKKLKDEGLMVFTFHHKGKEAWVSVLKTILNADFYVTAVYPIQAEMKTSSHIMDKANIEYDMVIVCRKRLDNPSSINWKKMQDQIYITVKDTIKLIEKNNHISEGDKFVIAMGKCLQIYSKNWPEVYGKDNEKVGIDQAIEDVKNIVSNYFSKSKFSTLQKETDLITAIYFQYLQGKDSIKYSDLNKTFQQRNFDISLIFDKQLAKKEKEQVIVLPKEERKEYLKNKSSNKMSGIDQAHYLLLLKDEGRLSKTDLTWVTEAGLNTIKRLDLERGDRLIKFVKKNRKQKKLV